MTSQEKLAELEPIKQTLKNAQDVYQQYVGGEELIPYLGKSAVTEKSAVPFLRQDEARLEKELKTARTDIGSPDYMPEVTNPLIRGKMAAQREASIYENLTNTRNTRIQQEGTIMDILGGISGIYKAKSSKQAVAIQAAEDEYDRVLEEYGILSEQEAQARAEERQRIMDEEDKRRYEADMQFDREKFEEENRQFAISESNDMKKAYTSAASSGDEEEKDAEKLYSGLMNDIYKSMISGKYSPSGESVMEKDENGKMVAYKLKSREDLIRELATKYNGQIDSEVIADSVWKTYRNKDEGQYPGLPENWKQMLGM